MGSEKEIARVEEEGLAVQSPLMSDKSAMVIKTDDDLAIADEYLSRVHHAIKVLEAETKPVREATKDAHTKACAMHRRLVDPLLKRKAEIRSLMSAYMDDREEREQKTIAEAPYAPEAQAIMSSQQVRSNPKTTSVFTIQVLDRSLLSREFMMPDMAKLKNLAKAVGYDAKKIAGKPGCVEVRKHHRIVSR